MHTLLEGMEEVHELTEMGRPHKMSLKLLQGGEQVGEAGGGRLKITAKCGFPHLNNWGAGEGRGQCYPSLLLQPLGGASWHPHNPLPSFAESPIAQLQAITQRKHSFPTRQA